MPQHLREQLAELGLCKDEFTDQGHWSPQLYVREGRRMKGMYVVSQKDVVADIKVTGGPAAAARTEAPAAKTYTVKAGDTLSGIAKDHLGSANAYMKIFELNKDQLTDPDKIKPGQVLKLP